MSEPAGPFKVVLASVEESWNSRLRSEVARLFQIDDETASNVVSAIPIVVLDGLDARTAGVVRERMRGLVEAGCRVVTTDDPADTIPRVNWPETPEIARIPAEEPRQVITVREVEGGSKAPPLASFACPGCGQLFHLSAASRVDQVGALAVPGASAPSGGMPGTGGSKTVADHSAPAATSSKSPSGGTSSTNGRVNGAERAPTKTPEPEPAEPGATLAGDDWLDPPLPAAKPAASKPAEKPAPSRVEAPAAAPTPAPPPPPPAPEPVKQPLRQLEPVASAAPPARAAEPARKAPSLLDDPLLQARRFDNAPGNPEQAPGLSTNEPTTLVARPITNRFSRSVVPQGGAPQTAPLPPPAPAVRSGPTTTVAPLPSARPASPGTQRIAAPPPVPSSLRAGSSPPSTAGSTPTTGRFAPPPPPPTPPASATRPATGRFGGGAPSGTAPVPPPSTFASLDSTKSDARVKKNAPIEPELVPDEDELDVHFDDASDIGKVEKLEKLERKKPAAKGKSFDDDDDLLPEGLDEDSIDDDPKAKKAAAAAREVARSPLESDDEDLLPFDELDSQTPMAKAPKAAAPKGPAPKGAKASSGDGSFDGGRIDDLLDEPPSATVSTPGRKPAKDLLDSDDDEDELLLDDEEPKASKKTQPPKKSLLDSADADDDELNERTLFGASDERPALGSKPAEKAPAGKGPKTKLPRESGFADALDMFDADDENPLDGDPALDASRSQNGDRLDMEDDEVPDIKPLDLASDVSGIPPLGKPGPKKGKPPESPFDRPSSSAILEPLDPNEAMAILKTHQKDDDPGLSDSGDDLRPTRKPASGAALEPLDPDDALAILGSPDDRGGKGNGKGGGAPKKPSRPKNGRTSEPSKLVPLSASDEDFAFLDPGKGSKGGANKGTDPFARAKKPGGGDKAPPPSGKKRSDPFEKANKLDSDDGEALPPPKAAPKKSPDASSRGGKGGRVPEGAGDCGLVLPRIATDDKRQKAAELISEIKGVGVDEALKLTERTIIPVLTGVSRDVAEFHREKFERNKISARVTTRSGKEK